ncbi:MAG: 4Fe-4S binding protein [Candidatus Stahlbacteria bacterium]|nr:4Fe-4S binding protein [Candidatus Stahlbacteria bacterium]
MKGIIYYYSGSGNTKLACQYIVKKIKNIEIDIFNIVKDGIPNLEKYNLVGFATFADFFGPPYLVQTFIENLPQQKDKLAFVFNTYGGMSGKTLKIFDKWVTAKGFKIIAYHSLHTPENYPPMIAKGRSNKQAPSKKEMNEFNNFISDLDRLLILLKKGKEIPKKKIKIGLLDSLIPTFSRTKARKDMGEKYVDEQLCTECGKCEKICPYEAIKLSPSPTFNMNKCYGCWACYNHCPDKAIYTKKYRGIGHYPEPHKQLKEKLKV